MTWQSLNLVDPTPIWSRLVLLLLVLSSCFSEFLLDFNCFYHLLYPVLGFGLFNLKISFQTLFLDFILGRVSCTKRDIYRRDTILHLDVDFLLKVKAATYGFQ